MSDTPEQTARKRQLLQELSDLDEQVSIIDLESVRYALEYVPSYIATVGEFDRWLEQHDNENYAAGRADERKALFAILEQLPFTWYGTKQNLDLGKDELIAFIEGKINE